MKAWPLRLKVSLGAIGLGLLTLAVLGSIVTWRVREAATARLDGALHSEINDIFTSIARNDGPMDWTNPDRVARAVGLVRSQRMLQIEQPAGRIVFQSQPLPFPAAKDGQPYATQIGNTPVRAAQLARDGLVVRLAADTEPIRHTTHMIWMACGIALPIVFLVMGLGGWWLSLRVLRPVKELAYAASCIDARISDHRLSATDGENEIQNLTNVLNEMFGRIKQSFSQARQFSADASHELKTPLTIIRGEVEAALRLPQLPPQIEKTMLDLLEETGRLINIVEGLLLLSQADAGKLQFDTKPVNMTVLLSEIVEDIEILADPMEIVVSSDFQPEVLVEGNAQFLRQVALNLFDNAIKYNIPKGQIRALLSVHGKKVIFSIANTGATVPYSDRDLIFDRFHRADASRERERGGQGLGLAICREIAAAHGGSISLEPSPTGWTKFQLVLPVKAEDLTDSAVRRATEGSAVPPLADVPRAVATRAGR